MGLKDKKWFQAVMQIAPTIATALGGPFAGLATNILGKVTGMKPEEIDEAIAAGDPEVFAKLQLAEQQFELELEALKIEKEQLVYDDIADARAMRVATKDWTPAVLTAIALTFFFTLSFAVLYNLALVQGESKDFAFYLFGVASGWVTQGMTFFLGSSKGSQRKTDLLANGRGTGSGK